MPTTRELFLANQAQTSDAPMDIDCVKAEGVWITDANGKSYIDLIAGIGVSNVGHCHPKVVEAVKKQAETYMHLMVYGEYIQSPQVKLSHKITSLLDKSLDNVYLVNSGSEAVEGALKLAKRYTGKRKIISCKDAYHGSTHGALSVMGNEYFKQNFRPLLPEVYHIEPGNLSHLDQIDKDTAAIIIEPVGAEIGINPLPASYFKAIKEKCKSTGTLLIFDEVQTGFGRCGEMFYHQALGVVPDILVLAKGMGGGMPIGAFVASKTIMQTLSHDPVLGHITTFGGHPVSCAGSLACIESILDENLIHQIPEKHALFRELLQHDSILEFRGVGLMIALQFENQSFNFSVIRKCIEKGVLTDWFLFNDSSLRIAPPLTISKDEIKIACKAILEAIEEVKLD